MSPPVFDADFAADPTGADCLACGRCCHHAPSTVGLLQHDEARLDEATLHRLTVVQSHPPHLRFLRTENGHCVALDESTPGRHACAIYATRPDGCRALEPDSPACREARRLGRLGQSVRYRRNAPTP